MELAESLQEGLVAAAEIAGGEGDGEQVERIVGKGHRSSVGQHQGRWALGVPQHGEAEVEADHEGVLRRPLAQGPGHIARTGTDIQPALPAVAGGDARGPVAP